MSHLSKLMQVTEEERKNILKEHHVTEEEFDESVRVIKDWMNKNDNFPEDAASYEHLIKVILINSKMSMEQSKKACEGFLTVKALYEDFFERLVPDERFNKIEHIAKNAIMPRLLPNLCRLQIAKLTPLQEEAENGLDYYVMGIMIGELRILKDFFLSTEMLIDLEHYNLKTMLKFTPAVNYKLVHLLMAINLRINKIHIVNSPPFMDKIMFVMKAFMPAKIFEKVKVHKSFEELHEFIPKEYLPSDYGGTEKSLEELHEMWCEELKENETLLKSLTKLKVKSVLRHQQDNLTDVGMGTDGSFKRLSID